MRTPWQSRELIAAAAVTALHFFIWKNKCKPSLIPALLELAWLYARSARWEEAVAICERLAAQGVLQAIARLAKYFEHSERNYRAALAYSEALLSQDSGNAAHQQRLNRVQAKLTKSSTPP
jgi:hypothetical protein